MLNEINIYFISGYISEIICFLGTTECEDYLKAVSKENRTLTINTLLTIEKNIKSKYKKEINNKCLIGLTGGKQK